MQRNFKRYKLNLEENITISDFANMEAYTEAMKKIEIDMNIDYEITKIFYVLIIICIIIYLIMDIKYN